MRGSRGTIVIACALFAAADAAAAAEHPAIVRAEVSATSNGAAASRAFDGKGATLWCPSRSDARGELVITFAEAVTIKALSLYVGDMPAPGSTYGEKPYRPSMVEVSAGSANLAIDPTENGLGPLDVEAARGQKVTRVAVRLPPSAPDLSRCLTEMEVEVEGGVWVHGIDEKAAASLPGAIAELTEALRACDARRLGARVRLPFLMRELQAGFAGAYIWFASTRPLKIAHAKALRRQCNRLVFPAVKDEPFDPKLSRGLGPGRVRVLAHLLGPVYWDLGCSKAGWKLEGVVYQDFE